MADTGGSGRAPFNRLSKIFLKDKDGRRPVYQRIEKFQSDPHWNDLLLFFEYFHGDNGSGVGASHQTGWTGLVAKLLQQSGTSSPSTTAPADLRDIQNQDLMLLLPMNCACCAGDSMSISHCKTFHLIYLTVMATLLVTGSALAQKPMMAVDRDLPLSAEQAAEAIGLLPLYARIKQLDADSPSKGRDEIVVCSSKSC